MSPWVRGKGIGALLLERAGLVATACGASTLFVRRVDGFAENITLADHRLRSGWSEATVHDFAVDEVCEPA